MIRRFNLFCLFTSVFGYDTDEGNYTAVIIVAQQIKKRTVIDDNINNVK